MKLGGRCDESFMFDVDINNMDTFQDHKGSQKGFSLLFSFYTYIVVLAIRCAWESG